MTFYVTYNKLTFAGVGGHTHSYDGEIKLKASTLEQALEEAKQLRKTERELSHPAVRNIFVGVRLKEL